MRRAVACFPAPSSASTSTGTSLFASSRITASTGLMLGLAPSTNAIPAPSIDARAPLLRPALGNALPILPSPAMRPLPAHQRIFNLLCTRGARIVPARRGLGSSFHSLLSTTCIKKRLGGGEKLQVCFPIHPRTMGKHFLTPSDLGKVRKCPNLSSFRSFWLGVLGPRISGVGSFKHRLDRHIDWNFALHTREVSLILAVFPCQLVRRSEP